MTRLTRRRLLQLGAPALILGGCDWLGASPSFRDLVLGSGEWLSYHTHRLIGSAALAREYDASEMSPFFRTNGNTRPRSPDYQRHAAQGFANWRLRIDGLVDAPASLSLTELRAMPSRTQITRHDCVEGWSAIGKWTGVPLAELLRRVEPKPAARYAVFRCADTYEETSDGTGVYYESIDMVDAWHPQTILAYAMNGADLPVAHGAPLRLRVERQLGYKHAKYVMRVELVDSFARIGRGNGGFWEDRGYEWYAGI
jgi:DMSO/TMAO reductase YedYZ molybdopterin-dependent catalytic subunit